MKKVYFFTLGQLVFLIISISVIAVLSFLFGVEVGKYLKTSEQISIAERKEALKTKVVVSLEQYSSLTKEGKKEGEAIEDSKEKVNISKREEAKEVKEESLIQIGAYREKTSYLELEKRLKSLGFQTRIAEGKLTKLFVVVERGKEEDALKRLEKEGIKGMMLKK